MLALISGFTIGLLGSFHCVGMCGPIALSLPIYHKKKIEQCWIILTYNLGRAMTYALIGLIIALLGNRLILFGFQQKLSIFAGVVILLILLFGFLLKKEIPFLEGFHAKVQNLLSSHLYAEKNIFSYWVIGMLNGLLPCGLVYVAVAAAITASTPVDAIFLMFAFGLGTMPLMVVLFVFGNFITLATRKKMRKISYLFVFLMGIFLLLRGLELGIPYISPIMTVVDKSGVISCG